MFWNGMNDKNTICRSYCWTISPEWPPKRVRPLAKLHFSHIAQSIILHAAPSVFESLSDCACAPITLFGRLVPIIVHKYSGYSGAHQRGVEHNGLWSARHGMAAKCQQSTLAHTNTNTNRRQLH